jgi:hypothetical protein
VFYQDKSYIFPVINKNGKHYISYKILTCRDKGIISQIGSVDNIISNGELCDGYWENENNYFALSKNGGILYMNNGEVLGLKEKVDSITIPTKTQDEIFIDIDSFCKCINANYHYDQQTNTFFITEKEGN